MEETDCSPLKELITKSLAECTDADLLDLIYKLIVTETGRE